MKLEPMIKMELKKFKDYYDINDDENIAFEKFVNFVLLSSHQPEAFSTNSYFIDSVHVGGENDMGIDGIGIKINETFVDTCQSVDDIIKLNNKINIEFIFVQSKYKSKFDSGEFGKFKDGMLDFLSEEHNELHNDKIEALLKIKDYIFSEKIMSSWEDSPSIKFYYVVMGEWNENRYILAKAKNFKNSVKQLNVYSEITDKYLDAKALKKMIDENNNKFTCTLNVSNSFPLQEVEDVTDSIIISCKAEEIIKMLRSYDNSIKKSVFNDNVRDYQGNTIVNEGILKTIRETPQKFTLMNNGMTIICKKALQSNRKVTLENPQIVNGCQTANVIFEAGKKKIDLSNVEVIIKIIATESLDISNNIVKANSKTSGEALKDDKLEKKISAVARHLELKDESDVEYQMIHAKDGKSYNDGNIELYYYDENSDDYKDLKDGKGFIDAAATNNGFVLRFVDNKKDEKLIEKFKKIQFK